MRVMTVSTCGGQRLAVSSKCLDLAESIRRENCIEEASAVALSIWSRPRGSAVRSRSNLVRNTSLLDQFPSSQVSRPVTTPSPTDSRDLLHPSPSRVFPSSQSSPILTCVSHRHWQLHRERVVSRTTSSDATYDQFVSRGGRKNSMRGQSPGPDPKS